MHENLFFFIALFAGGMLGLVASGIASAHVASLRKVYSQPKDTDPSAKKALDSAPDAPSSGESSVPSHGTLVQGILLVAASCSVSLFVAATYGLGQNWIVLLCTMDILFALAAVDARTYQLPDMLLVPATLLSGYCAVAVFSNTAMDILLGAIVAAGGIYVVGKLYAVVSKQTGIGLGDVKLLLCCGALGGVHGLPEIFFVAFVLAGGWILLRSMLPVKIYSEYIPMGPFLVAGTVYQVLFT